MTCPYFEPLEPLAEPAFHNARLPLIEQYGGICHVGPEPFQSTKTCCNHGYAHGQCERFPVEVKNTAHRFSLLRQDSGELELLFIREEDYAPAFTLQLHFSVIGNRLSEHDLDSCIAAQALAFCRSYLRKIVDVASA
ncbi:MAG TPA: hypothetical protein VFW94_02355 [Candidatus Acidoferrales bacterium]|nr:hypothetical protein [Candidatus Acidoferrales bacterium]